MTPQRHLKGEAMLTAIVLFWMAMQLEAPIWVYFIISLMFVTNLLTFTLDIIDKAQKRQIKKNMAKLTDEQYGKLADRYMEQFEEWRRENK